MIENSCLKFPVYHGTSSALIAEIAENGLGYTTLNKKYRIIEKMNEWLRIAEAKTSNSSVFSRSLLTLKKICDEQTEYLKYDAVYFSASIKKAYQYANYQGGPELIRYAKVLLEESGRKDSEMTSLFKKFEGSRGVVLQINNLSSEQAAGERGENIHEFLLKQKDLFVMSQKNAYNDIDYLQGVNIRFSGIIHWSQICILDMQLGIIDNEV